MTRLRQWRETDGEDTELFEDSLLSYESPNQADGWGEESEELVALVEEIDAIYSRVIEPLEPYDAPYTGPDGLELAGDLEDCYLDIIGASLGMDASEIANVLRWAAGPLGWVPFERKWEGTDISDIVSGWSDVGNLSKTYKVYLALCTFGERSHYSDIARKYNKMFPQDESSEHAIHATLGRGEHGIVYVGLHGTYGLDSWGDTRPDRTLEDTAADIVVGIYKETGKSVPRQLIIEEIEAIRPLNPASIPRTVDLNPQLIQVLGPAFIPKAQQVQAGSQPSIEESCIDLLPARMLIGPEFIGKNRNLVSNELEGFNVAEIKQRVYTGRCDTKLLELLTSHGQLEQLHQAIGRCGKTVSDWVDGIRLNPNFRWVVPSEELLNDLNDDSLRKHIIAHCPQLVIEGDVTWLGWLNIELANYVHRMKQADLNLILRSLRALSKDVTGEILDVAALPDSITGLPIFTLYNHGPSPKLMTLLKEINKRGYVNIGSLLPLAPQFYRAIRQTSIKDVTDLRRSLASMPSGSY